MPQMPLGYMTSSHHSPMGAEAGSDGGVVPQKNTRMGKESRHQEAKSLTSMPLLCILTDASVVKVLSPGWMFGSILEPTIIMKKYLLEDQTLSLSPPTEAETGEWGSGNWHFNTPSKHSDGLMF